MNKSQEKFIYFLCFSILFLLSFREVFLILKRCVSLTVNALTQGCLFKHIEALVLKTRYIFPKNNYCQYIIN